jgi:hypothetical protein
MMNSPIFNVCQFPEWAEVIAKEIETAKQLDPDWHYANNWRVDENGVRTTDPSNTTKGVFDDVKLHFVNRNFNILYEESTIQLALNGYEYNPLFTKSLELFEMAREFNKETGPFGRMIVWDCPPGSKISAHVDNLPYQTNVTRYIFTASNQSSPDISVVINNNEISLNPGMMFAFHAEDLHEFTNHSNDYWYFLGIDYWIPEKLQQGVDKYNITKDTIIDYDSTVGHTAPKAKFWTRH